MPELPEVETIKRSIAPLVTGKRINRIRFFRDDLREQIPKRLVTSILKASPVKEVTRRSKYLLLHTSSGHVIIHFGMSGQLLYREEAIPTINHTHVVMGIEGGGYLHYVDPRRFGWFTAAKQDHGHRLLDQLGPEPLEEGDLGAFLFRQSRGKKTPIKHFVMNAKNVVGVGNIYASESLFLAGIHPESLATALTARQYTKLAEAIQMTLRNAILAGGTTLKDFKKADGSPGYFATELNVYGREGEPCRQCKAQIEHTRMSGRATFFCKKCQKKTN